VSRFENEDALDRVAERLKARLQILDRRREIVEHPFGSIKQWMYSGRVVGRVGVSARKVGDPFRKFRRGFRTHPFEHQQAPESGPPPPASSPLPP
jgi:hypothetical protein